MSEYKIMYRLDCEKIKGVAKGTKVIYYHCNKHDIIPAFDYLEKRNIEAIKVSYEEYMFCYKYLRKQPKQIIEYFLQNGIDKTKELLYS